MSDEVRKSSKRKRSKVNPPEEGLYPSSSQKKRCVKPLKSTKEATKEEEGKVNPIEEGLYPSSSHKKKCDKPLKSTKEATKEEESHLEAIVKEKEEGDSKVKAMPSTVVSSGKPTEPEVTVGTHREVSKEIRELGEEEFIVEEVPSTSVVPCLKIIAPKIFNDEFHDDLNKEIKNLGDGYERIFLLLEEVQGTLEFKKELVEYAIKEVKRLKTKDLIKHLEKKLKKINKRIKKKKSQI